MVCYQHSDLVLVAEHIIRSLDKAITSTIITEIELEALCQIKENTENDAYCSNIPPSPTCNFNIPPLLLGIW